MEKFVLITLIGFIVIFLVLMISTILYVYKNQNVKIDKILKQLNRRIKLSVILMVVIAILNIIYIILKLN